MLWTTYQVTPDDPDSEWTVWEPWPSDGADLHDLYFVTVANLKLTTKDQQFVGQPGRMQLWVTAGVDAILSCYKERYVVSSPWTPIGPWTNTDGTSLTPAGAPVSIAAGALADGRLKLWTGNPAHLMTIEQLATDPFPGPWGQWDHFALPVNALSDFLTIAAVPLADKRLCVFAAGMQQTVISYNVQQPVSDPASLSQWLPAWVQMPPI
jgi:hypothetical protein